MFNAYKYYENQTMKNQFVKKIYLTFLFTFYTICISQELMKKKIYPEGLNKKVNIP